MTSLAWPIESEWRLWFLNKQDKACAAYYTRLLNYGELLGNFSFEQTKSIFHDCENVLDRRGHKPYDIFIRRRIQRIFVILQINNFMGSMGHW